MKNKLVKLTRQKIESLEKQLLNNDHPSIVRGNTDSFAAEIKTFMGFFSEDIVEGDTYDITYQTGKGVVCYKNKKELGSIQGMDFKKALFGIWLGENPADSNLKSGMLGK